MHVRPDARLTRTIPPAAALLALTFLLATPAHAGFGDLVKAAKNKAAQTAATRVVKPGGGAAERVEFTDEILELSGSRLEQVLKGFDAASAITADRAALVAKRARMESEANALEEKQGKAISGARQRHDDAEECWNHSLQAKREEREKATQEKMMADPAMREKMMALGQRMAVAQAKGDAEGVRKAQAEIMGLAGPTHADTVAAQQKCGPVPPLHPAAARIDSLRAAVQDANDSVRAMDRKAIGKQSMASGMEPEQFAMAQERIELYLQAVRANGTPHGFTDGELKALASHRDALESALGSTGQ
jgi:hypothetical protein